MVSRLKHSNFVELIGYCLDGNQRVLAYEFASNGSLHDILHGMHIAYFSYNFSSLMVQFCPIFEWSFLVYLIFSYNVAFDTAF